MAEAAYSGQADDAGGTGGPVLDWPTIGKVAEDGVDSLGVVAGHVVTVTGDALKYSIVCGPVCPAGGSPR